MKVLESLIMMKNLRALFGLAILVAGGYAGWKLIPPYFSNYQFQDTVENMAKFETYTKRTEAEITRDLARKAEDLEIPLTAEQIHVQRTPNGVTIWAEYEVHVDLPGYPVDLKFHPASKNRAVL